MQWRHAMGLSAALAIGGLAALFAADLTATPAGPPVKPAPKTVGPPACGSHGTAVDFVATPSEAAAKARKEQKLVFVLHVSGHFETPEFT